MSSYASMLIETNVAIVPGCVYINEIILEYHKCLIIYRVGKFVYALNCSPSSGCLLGGTDGGTSIDR